MCYLNEPLLILKSTDKLCKMLSYHLNVTCNDCLKLFKAVAEIYGKVSEKLFGMTIAHSLNLEKRRVFKRFSKF